VGVGIGHKIKVGKDTGERCLTVFVSQKLEPALVRVDDLVPETLGKFKTDVVESGHIFAGGISLEELPTHKQEEVDVEVLSDYIRPAKEDIV
jgi:hypothetical protein